MEASKIQNTFVFHCRFYQGHRNTLLNACTTYQNPSLNLLPFGSSTFSQTLQFWTNLKFTRIHQTFYVIKHYAKAIYTYTCMLQLFNLPISLWCLLLSPTPTPTATQVILLASTTMLFFLKCIICLHKAVYFMLLYFSFLNLYSFCFQY